MPAKTYFFSPGGQKLSPGDRVIVETARGIECGSVAIPNRLIDDGQIIAPLKGIIRRADEQDLQVVEENARKEKEAFKVCQQRIAARGLEMHLVDVEYTFDGNKILFYFTADGRVDFRELVKDLAGVFRTRIELRQIGVRDESKMLGGLGICGRPFCCSTFLGDFQPVSIKMAKEQNLSLNPTKISGTCGRLMCCLKYEQAAYEDLIRTTPKVGRRRRHPRRPRHRHRGGADPGAFEGAAGSKPRRRPVGLPPGVGQMGPGPCPRPPREGGEGGNAPPTASGTDARNRRWRCRHKTTCGIISLGSSPF